jgi:hypothetical protein
MSPWDPDGRGPRSGRCVTRAQTSILIRPLGSRSRAAWGRQGLLPDGIGGTPLSLPWWPDRVVGWTPLHPPPGRDPRAPKTGQIRASRGPNFSGFLGPCGAAPRGGGGAPPTTLILLRNQRPRTQPPRAPARTPSGALRGAVRGLPRRKKPKKTLFFFEEVCRFEVVSQSAAPMWPSAGWRPPPPIAELSEEKDRDPPAGPTRWARS